MVYVSNMTWWYHHLKKVLFDFRLLSQDGSRKFSFTTMREDIEKRQFLVNMIESHAYLATSHSSGKRG